MLDFPKRLEALRTRMAEQNIGLVFLPPVSNLFYLTGIPNRDHFRTDHNAYGDWAVGGYIGASGGVILTAPRMGGSFSWVKSTTSPGSNRCASLTSLRSRWTS